MSWKKKLNSENLVVVYINSESKKTVRSSVRRILEFSLGSHEIANNFYYFIKEQFARFSSSIMLIFSRLLMDLAIKVGVSSFSRCARSNKKRMLTLVFRRFFMVKICLMPACMLLDSIFFYE